MFSLSGISPNLFSLCTHISWELASQVCYVEWNDICSFPAAEPHVSFWSFPFKGVFCPRWCLDPWMSRRDVDLSFPHSGLLGTLRHIWLSGEEEQTEPLAVRSRASIMIFYWFYARLEDKRNTKNHPCLWNAIRWVRQIQSHVHQKRLRIQVMTMALSRTRKELQDIGFPLPLGLHWCLG